MEIKDFETWFDIVSAAVLSQVELQKNGTLDHLSRLRGVNQSRHLSRNQTLSSNGTSSDSSFPRSLVSIVKMSWSSGHTHKLTCLQAWELVLSVCTEAWRTMCRDSSGRRFYSGYFALVCRKAAFEIWSLPKDLRTESALWQEGRLLCRASGDLSTNPWDVSTGEFVYGI